MVFSLGRFGGIRVDRRSPGYRAGISAALDGSSEFLYYQGVVFEA
jgi:hypothetical protein